MPTIKTCGAVEEAEGIYGGLVNVSDFAPPAVDLNNPNLQFPESSGNSRFDDIDQIDIEKLTTERLDGSGTFDVMMRIVSMHLEKEFRSNRITGREYAEAYTASINASLNQAVAFLLQKDSAHWAAVVAQSQARRAEIDAVTARVELEIQKLNLANRGVENKILSADFANRKMQLALMDQDFCHKLEQVKLTREQVEEVRAATLDTRTDGSPIAGVIGMDKATKQYNLENILPAQLEGMEAATAQTTYQTANILPAQKVQAEEQANQIRAQTSNTRSDGMPVEGLSKAQRDLLEQQKESYERDAEIKAAKMFLDSWITQKTIDEGLLPPDALNNASVQTVMNKIKTVNGLV